MSNRQNYPASLFPLRGDLSAEAGAVTVEVVGIQNFPIEDVAPVNTNSLVFIDGVWVHVDLDASILINGAPQSDDYAFLVNNVGLEVLIGWAFGFSSQVFVNGSAI